MAVWIQVLPDMSTSIGGNSGPEPKTVRAAHSKHGGVDHSATPARLCSIILVCESSFSQTHKIGNNGNVRVFI